VRRNGDRLAFGRSRDVHQFEDTAAVRYVRVDDVGSSRPEDGAKVGARIKSFARDHWNPGGVADVGERFDIFRLARLLEPVGLEFGDCVGQVNGMHRREAAMNVQEQIDIRTDRIAHRTQHSHSPADMLLWHVGSPRAGNRIELHRREAPFDDAFGGTQLDWQGTIRWNGAFPHVRAAIRRGAKFVFTSRDYIYKNARNFLKESALPVMNEAQVVIRVEHLTKDEREQILYNHIRLGPQPPTFKREIKSLLPAVAVHKRFSPEIARRLGNPAFTKTLHLSAYSLDDFVENNTELLQEVIRTLDAGSRSAIALVFMRDGLLQSPITLTPEEERGIELLGASPGEVRTAIAALDGGLLIQVQQRGSVWWRFKHPTIRDAFAALVAENRELMDIYLLGTPIERLFTEISCGNAKMRGIKVVVPADRYEALMPRVESFLRDRRENQDAVNRFLASRCGRVFLARFLQRNPDFLASLDLMSYFYAVSDVSLVNRLQELELLPEDERLRHVGRVRELAVRTPDAGFLDKEVVSFLTEDEVKDILEHVRSSFVPNLDACIESWRDAHDRREDPEEGFRHLKTALQEYETALSEDTLSTSFIDSALTRIDEVVQELQAEVPETPDWGDHYPRQGPSEESGGSRSIFDDVDE